jgi:hypothetical protein
MKFSFFKRSAGILIFILLLPFLLIAAWIAATSPSLV